MGISVERVVPGSSELGCLLIHGLTGSPAEMAPIAERLAGRHPLWVTRVAGHDTTPADLAKTPGGSDSVLYAIEPNHWVGCWRTEYLEEHASRRPDIGFRRSDE